MNLLDKFEPKAPDFEKAIEHYKYWYNIDISPFSNDTKYILAIGMEEGFSQGVMQLLRLKQMDNEEA